jgi:hypothetical protein
VWCAPDFQRADFSWTAFNQKVYQEAVDSVDRLFDTPFFVSEAVTMTATTGRRGLIAAVCVVLAVVAAVFMVSMRSTGTVVPSVSRKLVGPSSLLENKMAFKAMKMNTKYELKSEQKTILRGGSIQIRHDAAAAMKANIYSGIKDMKRVVLAGLDKGKRRLTEVADSVHRKLPSVHVIKGAYAAMKGQILESPRGSILIDAQSRDIVQDVYIRKVERVDGQLYNVEFDVQKAVKDPGKLK